MKIEKINETPVGSLIYVIGRPGIGKTTLLYSLPEEKTLFLDVEKGKTSVSSWEGDSIPLDCWNDIKDIACLIAGANPSLPDNVNIPYSQAHFNQCLANHKEIYEVIQKKDIIFFDSLTMISKFCKQKAFADYPSKKDSMNAWGQIGKDLVEFMGQMRNSTKTIIFTGGLSIEQEAGVKVYDYLIDGRMSKGSIPYIFDVILTMEHFNNIYPTKQKWEDKNPELAKQKRDENERFFVCNQDLGMLSKNRSELKPLEEADLGLLLEKLQGRREKPDFFKKPSCVKTPEEVEQMKKELEKKK